jgi:predicted outer membrane repeat protein
MRCATSAGVVLLSWLIFLSGALGSDRYVPSEYTTIQAAVAAALPGDTVRVADGIYSGPGNINIDLMGKAITVKSVNGPENTTISCGSNGRGFLLVNGEGANTIIEGFTVKDGYLPDWPDGGGGIYCLGTAPVIRFCIFENNHAYYGGAIYFDDAAAPKIENCQFTLNIAQYGGALYGKYSTATIANSLIDSNVANWTGGGLYLYECTNVNLSDSVISSNIAVGKSGGGLFDYYTSGVISNCEFIENIAGVQDGGAINSSDGMAITDCSFVNNFAKDDGGAIFTWTSDADITNSYFEGNSADGAGGGIYFYNESESIVRNSVFDKNSSPVGGAIYSFWNASCKPKIINCTITNSPGGGGIYRAADGQPEITNTILWGNEPEQIIQSGYSSQVTYSNIQGGHPGTGNIMEDPLFIDPHNGNFRISAGSPCIDSGTSVGAPADDLDGNLRPSGVGVDMGAYEFIPAPVGDFDSDNDTDGFDLSHFAVVYSIKTSPEADINDDGSINAADVARFAQDFGGI